MFDEIFEGNVEECLLFFDDVDNAIHNVSFVGGPPRRCERGLPAVASAKAGAETLPHKIDNCNRSIPSVT